MPEKLDPHTHFFLIGAEHDWIAPVSRNQQKVFDQTNPMTPTVFGIRKHFGHLTVFGAADPFRGYIVAFIAAHLKDDPAATALFEPANCGICGDPNWTVKRNFTGP
jgi:hypothetical protein